MMINRFVLGCTIAKRCCKQIASLATSITLLVVGCDRSYIYNPDLPEYSKPDKPTVTKSTSVSGNEFDSHGYFHPVITSDRLPYPYLPDPNLTPGVRIPGVTREQVCTPGYTKGVRKTTLNTKRAVFAAYHVKYERNMYEVDHFLALELGGADTTDTSNLFPQPRDVEVDTPRSKETGILQIFCRICWISVCQV